MHQRKKSFFTLHASAQKINFRSTLLKARITVKSEGKDNAFKTKESDLNFSKHLLRRNNQPVMK